MKWTALVLAVVGCGHPGEIPIAREEHPPVVAKKTEPSAEAEGVIAEAVIASATKVGVDDGRVVVIDGKGTRTLVTTGPHDRDARPTDARSRSCANGATSWTR